MGGLRLGVGGCGGRGCGCLVDGLADAWVGAATADVAVHGSVDLGVGGMRRVGEQSGGGHDLAGLAVAALRARQAAPTRPERDGCRRGRGPRWW